METRGPGDPLARGVQHDPIRELPRVFRRAILAADKDVICFVVDDDRLAVRIMATGRAGLD